MFRKLAKTLTSVVSVLIVVSSLALAQSDGDKVPEPIEVPTPGSVIAVHAHGMVTVQTEDGQEIEVYGKGWQVGDQVECQRKGDGKAGTCKRLS